MIPYTEHYSTHNKKSMTIVSSACDHSLRASVICHLLVPGISQFSQFLPCHDIARTASFSRARKGIKKKQNKKNKTSRVISSLPQLLFLLFTPPFTPLLIPPSLPFFLTSPLASSFTSFNHAFALTLESFAFTSYSPFTFPGILWCARQSAQFQPKYHGGCSGSPTQAK